MSLRVQLALAAASCTLSDICGHSISAGTPQLPAPDPQMTATAYVDALLSQLADARCDALKPPPQMPLSQVRVNHAYPGQVLH